MKKKGKKLLAVLGIIVVLVVGACLIFHAIGYDATEEARAEITTVSEKVSVTMKPQSEIVYIPDEPKAGLIFYPGGNVEYEAYTPLMKALADEGILCVLLHMPGDLAVLDIKAADGIIAQYPQIDRWYIGGHSLGGSMAATYVSKHVDEFEGLILLAAYSTADLTDSGLNVISLYGSEDGVLGMGTYEKHIADLPADYTEHVIEGGCHALFGDYGPQRGDGEPTISREEQTAETVQVIAAALGLK